MIINLFYYKCLIIVEFKIKFVIIWWKHIKHKVTLDFLSVLLLVVFYNFIFEGTLLIFFEFTNILTKSEVSSSSFFLNLKGGSSGYWFFWNLGFNSSLF
jgi:hypothetical protein